ncbi:ABC transporter permease [Aeromicrobium sp. PE09-221]|uniref:ABC transporter permease n=1 Tax=Aeromicrobium sp. PE09-221 TaxID=1898043 RepID=UPI000B3E9770|nr:ABC transporter permease subunit [Aeromicrobium sp. PE09-221]OUZ07756.1 ABC transporter permease [Aeromicrobium sp. PE09-221]
MNWALANRDLLVELTWQHVWVSAVCILLGFALALPVGWFAYAANRSPRRPMRQLSGGVLSIGSILYTIPSLPLLVILPSLLGLPWLSVLSIVIALTVYAFAIMVRSVADALRSVPPMVLDSATACGYSRTQRALTVTLPLAGPVMLASLRVVSVSTVSLLSIGALTGVRNLGSLFTNGYNRDFTTEIATGIVLTVIVALVFDAIIVASGRLLMPWSRVVRAGGGE